MQRLGIATGADLRERELSFLTQQFGKAGAWYYGIARGEDERAVNPDRPRKSAGSETTFADDLTDPARIEAELTKLADDVWRWIERTGGRGRTVTVKARYADFRTVTRSRTLGRPVDAREMLHRDRDHAGPQPLSAAQRAAVCSASPCRASTPRNRRPNSTSSLGDLVGVDVEAGQRRRPERGGQRGVGRVAAARHQDAADPRLCCGARRRCATRRPDRRRTRRRNPSARRPAARRCRRDSRCNSAPGCSCSGTA